MNVSCVAWMELDAFDVARLSGGCSGGGGVRGRETRARRRGGSVGHISGAFLDVLKSEQTEWGGLAGAVALGAMLENNRSDVFAEGELTRWTWSILFRGGGFARPPQPKDRAEAETDEEHRAQ